MPRVREYKCRLTRQQLIAMYHQENLSQKAIADLVGVGQATISRMMREMGIPTRQITVKDDPHTQKWGNEAVLTEYYVHRGYTANHIAKISGFTASTILRWLKQFNIELRPVGESISRGKLAASRVWSRAPNLSQTIPMTSVPGAIRVVAIDLDGTLIVDNQSTDPANLAAIHQAQIQGVTVVICTGRPYPSANQVASQLGLTDNPIISYNGALVRMPGDGEVLFSQPVPAELAEQVVQDCVERQLQIHYFLDDVMYVPRVSAGARLYGQRTGMQPVPAGDLRKFAGRSPTKILVFAGPEVVRRLRPEFESRYDGKLYVTTSMPEYLEFLHPEVSKGNALRALADRHGLDASQIMAIGDLLNDLPMIEMAGVGVAVAHAEEALKSEADYVTDSSERAVAEALERFVLKSS